MPGNPARHVRDREMQCTETPKAANFASASKFGQLLQDLLDCLGFRAEIFSNFVFRTARLAMGPPRD
jgi:hypothetical protein